MDPAMAICTGIAAVTLSVGLIGSIGAVGRRLATIHVPVPVRPVATLLMVTSLAAVLVRPRPAAATVAPPIVRLVDESVTGDDETTVTRPPEETPSMTVVRGGHPGAGDDVYVVEAGDCLWRIAGRILADRTGTEPSNAAIARFWPAIYDMNVNVIGHNPSLIFPGQRLAIPEG